jgi:AcrR family transcriptional regulator
LLEAALALLSERGLEAMTVEEVAARAGASKATFYRWWSSKEELLIEAVEELSPSPPRHATSSPREEVVVVLREMARALSTPRGGGTMARMIGASASNLALGRIWRERMVVPRLRVLEALLTEAQKRGELRRGVDVALAADMLVGALLFRRLVRDAPLPPVALAEHLVDTLWVSPE